MFAILFLFCECVNALVTCDARLTHQHIHMLYNLLCCLQFVGLVEVVGVQLLVAEMAARFTVVLLVDGENFGILVALTDGFALVFAIDGLHTLADNVAVAMIGDKVYGRLTPDLVPGIIAEYND